MKMDLDNPSTFLSGGAGLIIFGLAYKFIWPILSASLNTALTTNKTTDLLLKQVIEERDRAVLRADEADKRLEGMVRELYELKNSVNFLTYQLESANKKIEALTDEVRRLEGGKRE